MRPPFIQQVEYHVEPLLLLSLAVYHYAITATQAIILDRSFQPLISGQVRARAFASFWITISPPAAGLKGPSLPGPFAPLPALLASVNGDVLEMGSGSGSLMTYLDPSKIRSMYGVEPGTQLHAALRESADAVGLGDKFNILACGGEENSLVPTLSRADLKPGGQSGLFDTMISIRSLCSIPHPAESIKTHYGLLKPGGRFIICEHVINPWPAPNGSLLGRMLQIVYTALGWSYFVGDCHLTRDTIAMLMDAAKADGGWEKVELQRNTDWATLPFVTGVLEKPA